MSDSRLSRLHQLKTLSLGPSQQVDTAHYKFTLPPIPKGRPRAQVGKNGQIWMRTPRETEEYEDQIKKATKIQHPQHAPFVGDLSVFIIFYLADRNHQGDVDNLSKSILDGMQTVAFKDDKQILSLYADIYFMNEGAKGPPRTEVTVCRRTKENYDDDGQKTRPAVPSRDGEVRPE